MPFTLKIDRGTMSHVLKKAMHCGITPVDFLSWKQRLEFDVGQDKGRLRFIPEGDRKYYFEYVEDLFADSGGNFRVQAHVEWDQRGDSGYLLDAYFTPIEVKLHHSARSP